jgi:hypothetical protein
MQRTRREFLDEFLGHVGDSGDEVSRNAAEHLLNRALGTVWLANTWRDHVLPDPVQVTTVAGQRSYALPAYFGRIPPQTRSLRNLSTAGLIALRNRSELEREYPELGTSLETPGVPRFAYVGGVLGARVQPSSTGNALEVVSDNAADTDIRVLVEGVNSAGEYDEMQVTLSGTSAVGLGTWRAPLIRFGKSYPHGTAPATELTTSRGTVTLRIVAGATLQALLPEESAREFPSVTLVPAPQTSGEVIAIPTIRAPKRVLYDADVLPRFWHDALFEEMVALWREKAGTVPSAATLPRPYLQRLIAFDNTAQASEPIVKQPFGVPRSHVRP